MASLLALALPSAARADEGHYLGYAKSSSMTSNTTNDRGERCDSCRSRAPRAAELKPLGRASSPKRRWSFESISALWAEALGLMPDLHLRRPTIA